MHWFCIFFQVEKIFTLPVYALLVLRGTYSPWLKEYNGACFLHVHKCNFVQVNLVTPITFPE